MLGGWPRPGPETVRPFPGPIPAAPADRWNPSAAQLPVVWGEFLATIAANEGYQVVPTGYYDTLALTGGAAALAGTCQAGVLFGENLAAGPITQAVADQYRTRNQWHMVIGPVTPDVGYSTTQVLLPVTNRPFIIIPFTTIEPYSVGGWWTLRRAE